MTKDSDFLNLLYRIGPAPEVIWITCGSTYNRRMRQISNQTLLPAFEMLEGEEEIVEIGDQ